MASEQWIITGGCGFLGSNLAAHLLSAGASVAVIDNLSRVGSSHNLAWLRSLDKDGRLVHLHADTRSAGDIDDAFARFADSAAVAHLAGQVAMTTSLERPRYDFEVNALGAINVLEAARRRTPKAALFFSSTNKVYGDMREVRAVEEASRWSLPDWPRGIPETFSLSFESPYGCSKGAADQYFLDYHRMFGLRTVVFRHSSIYGGRQFATKDQGWIGWFCAQALDQAEAKTAGQSPAAFTISGDGKQVRDVLHAEDLVRCYLAAYRNIEACSGKVFNIGGGPENSLSLLELFSLLAELTGTEPRFEKIAWRSSDQKVFVADISRAEQTFGWRPKVSSREGVRRMLEWCRSPSGRALV